MKKLLLAFIITLGITLPSMAKDCQEHYGWNKIYGTDKISTAWHDVTTLIRIGDLECLEYVVNELGVDLSQESQGYSPVYYAVNSEKEISFDILNFLIDNGANLIEDNATDSHSERQGKSSGLGIALYLVMVDYEHGKGFDTLRANKLKLLLNKGGKSIWEAIPTFYVNDFISSAVYYTEDTGLIKFLIDQNMPMSEYDRYTRYVKTEMAEAENRAKKDGRACEECRLYKDILNLFEQAKADQLQTVNDNIGKTLTKITEENLNKIEEETQNQYNYQF